LVKQNDLSAIDYHDLMMDNIDEVTDKRLNALKKIEKDKFRVARAYNKKIKLKSKRSMATTKQQSEQLITKVMTHPRRLGMAT
jgi:hypothetical protein